MSSEEFKYKEIKYADILKLIKKSLDAADSWNKGSEVNEAQHRCYDVIQAQTLIELLEVHNCGQRGGCDRGQEPPRDLRSRYEWLANRKPPRIIDRNAAESEHGEKLLESACRALADVVPQFDHSYDLRKEIDEYLQGPSTTSK